MNRLRAVLSLLTAPTILACTVMSVGCAEDSGGRAFVPPILSRTSFTTLCVDACNEREVCGENSCGSQCHSMTETLYPHCSGPAFDYFACLLDTEWSCDDQLTPQPSDGCIVEGMAVFQCLTDWTLENAE